MVYSRNRKYLSVVTREARNKKCLKSCSMVVAFGQDRVSWAIALILASKVSFSILMLYSSLHFLIR